MTVSNDRLEKLQKLLEKQPTDAFLLYGIAMEHKKAGSAATAVEFLDRCLAVDPGYCYAYYQKAQICAHNGQHDLAQSVYVAGIEAAKKKSDHHAQAELEAAMQLLG